jgi:hypothetical protein
VANRNTKSAERKKKEHSRWFKKAQCWRTGCEGRIGVLKRRHGFTRCCYRGAEGMNAGLGVMADTLIRMGNVLAARAWSLHRQSFYGRSSLSSLEARQIRSACWAHCEIARRECPLMPGNIQAAVPSGVMPNTLSTAFTESRKYVQLQAQYHDGTIERSQLAQTSRKTFRSSMRQSHLGVVSPILCKRRSS